MNMHYTSFLAILVPMIYYFIFFFLKTKNIKNEISDYIKKTAVINNKFNVSIQNILEITQKNKITDSINTGQNDIKNKMAIVSLELKKMQQFLVGKFNELEKLEESWKNDKEYNTLNSKTSKYTAYIEDENVKSLLKKCDEVLTTYINKKTTLDLEFYHKYPIDQLIKKNTNMYTCTDTKHTQLCYDTSSYMHEVVEILQICNSSIESLTLELKNPIAKTFMVC